MLTWNEIVQNYISKHSNRIRKATQPLRDHFGIGYFTYHRIDNAGKYTVLVDRPDWAEYYVSEQIFLHDPFLRHPSVYLSGICLIESVKSEEFKDIILKKAKKVLNIDMGAILIQKKNSYVEFFGFCSNKKTSSLENIYVNRPQLFTSFAAHFKRELDFVLNQMEEAASSLIDLKGQDFNCNDPVNPDIASDTLQAYYKDLGMQEEVDLAQKLSPRERQCLKLLIENKSAKESATILGLSSRTVEYYFENIKNKFSCWNKQEIFRKAKALEELGLL